MMKVAVFATAKKQKVLKLTAREIKMAKKITKKMTFAELTESNPEAVEKLLRKGMHCGGCPMAMMETLEQGCDAHGINPEELVKELNEKRKSKK